MDQNTRDFISGEAGMVHPFSRASYPAGAICKQGYASSIVEVMRFELRSFTLDDQKLASYWLGSVSDGRGCVFRSAAPGRAPASDDSGISLLGLVVGGFNSI
jgi:hypothetical protein